MTRKFSKKLVDLTRNDPILLLIYINKPFYNNENKHSELLFNIMVRHRGGGGLMSITINTISSSCLTIHRLVEVHSLVGVKVYQTLTRHNFVGEIRIFSVKIRINPYPSFMHRCIAKTFTRFISRYSLKKIATSIDSQQQQRTKIGA